MTDGSAEELIHQRQADPGNETLGDRARADGRGTAAAHATEHPPLPAQHLASCSGQDVLLTPHASNACLVCRSKPPTTRRAYDDLLAARRDLMRTTRTMTTTSQTHEHTLSNEILGLRCACYSCSTHHVCLSMRRATAHSSMCEPPGMPRLFRCACPRAFWDAAGRLVGETMLRSCAYPRARRSQASDQCAKWSAASGTCTVVSTVVGAQP